MKKTYKNPSWRQSIIDNGDDPGITLDQAIYWLDKIPLYPIKVVVNGETMYDQQLDADHPLCGPQGWERLLQESRSDKFRCYNVEHVTLHNVCGHHMNVYITLEQRRNDCYWDKTDLDNNKE